MKQTATTAGLWSVRNSEHHRLPLLSLEIKEWEMMVRKVVSEITFSACLMSFLWHAHTSTLTWEFRWGFLPQAFLPLVVVREKQLVRSFTYKHSITYNPQSARNKNFLLLSFAFVRRFFVPSYLRCDCPPGSRAFARTWASCVLRCMLVWRSTLNGLLRVTHPHVIIR